MLSATSANSAATFSRPEAHKNGAMVPSAAVHGTNSPSKRMHTDVGKTAKGPGDLPPSTYLTMSGARREPQEKANGAQSTQPQRSSRSRATAGSAPQSGPSSRSVSKERAREQERAAARQAEKENWERTRGAGSSVMHLLEEEGVSADRWTAEAILPKLSYIESRRYEPVHAPSPDLLLSRGIADYTLLPKVLGRGKFSTVFMASKNGELSAIKHTALFPHHHLISTRLLREPTLLAELPPHPNLVEVKETIRTPGHFYLIEEFLGGYVTLEALIAKLSRPDRDVPVLPLKAAEVVLSQLLSAVRAIHHPLQVCHRDIKPENILVHESTLHLKLLDFGLATHFSKSEPKLTTCCGSPAFHCPEIVKALASTPGTVSYWGPEVDAWTCGVTMLRVLTGVRYPLGSSHSSLRSMAARAQKAVAQIPLSDEPGGDETLGRSMREKVARLLEMDASKRIKNFEEMAIERDKEVGVPVCHKDFKSTTFVPTEANHKMPLPLLSQKSAEMVNLSTYISRTSISHTPGMGGSYFGNPSSTPSSSTRGTPANSRPPSPEKEVRGSIDRKSPLPGPPRLVMLNPQHQPAQRVLSYIKYCMRCAGILYHGWSDSATSSQAPEGWSNLFAQGDVPEGVRSPTTPFPVASLGDRSDGWAHVHIFQCVIEYEEPSEPLAEATANAAKGLMQSIFAAFGRKPTPMQRSASQPGGLSTPRKPGTASPAKPGSGIPSSQAMSPNTEYLTFYMVVKFPKRPRALSRPAASRMNTAQTSKRNRASSAAATTSFAAAFANEVTGPRSSAEMHEDVETPTANTIQSSPSTADSIPKLDATTPTRHVLASSKSSAALAAGQQQKPLASTGLAIETNPDILKSLNNAHVGGNMATPGSRSATPTRVRKHSRAAATQRPLRGDKVFIEVLDERALETVRKALAVGGVEDSSDVEDAWSPKSASSLRGGSGSERGSSATLYEDPEGLTPTKATLNKSSSVARAKLRASRSQSYAGPKSSGGRSSGPSTASSAQSSGLASMDEHSFQGQLTPRRESFDAAHDSYSSGRSGRSAGLSAQPQSVRYANSRDSSRSRPESGFDDSSRGFEDVRAPAPLAPIDHSEPDENLLSSTLKHNGTVISRPFGISPIGEEVSGGKPGVLHEDAAESKKVRQDSEGAKGSGRSILNERELAQVIEQVRLASDRDLSSHNTADHSTLLYRLDSIHRQLALSSDESGGEHLISQRAELLDQHLFALCAAILPLLGWLNHAEISSAARRILTAAVEACSPRECLMALQERLDVLAKSESDEQEEDANEGVGATRHDTAEELSSIMGLLNIVLSRLSTKKPASFLEPLVELLCQTLRAISRETLSTELCERLSQSTAKLIATAHEWQSQRTADDDARGFCSLLLTQLLAVSFVTLAPWAPSDTASSPAADFFGQRWPRYRHSLGPTGAGAIFQAHKPLEGVIDLLEASLNNLALTWRTEALQQQSAALQIAAFITLVETRMSDNNKSAFSSSPAEVLEKLRTSLPLLMVALGGAPLSGDSEETSARLKMRFADCALLWLMRAFEALDAEGTDKAAQLPEEILLPLVQLLSTYASVCPAPQHRLMSFTLLGDVLENRIPHSSSEDRNDVLLIDLFRDLVAESPFPQLRAASVGLVKDLLNARARKGADSGLSPEWVSFLQADVLVLPQALPQQPGADEAHSEFKSALGAYFESHGPLLLQILNLAYYLLRRRQDAASAGAEIDRSALDNNLVKPLQQAVRYFDDSAAAFTPGEVNPVMLIADALARVEEA